MIRNSSVFIDKDDEETRKHLLLHQDEDEFDEELGRLHGGEIITRAARNSGWNKLRKHYNRRWALLILCLILLSLPIISWLKEIYDMELVQQTRSEELKFLRDNPYLDKYLRPLNESCLVCPRRLEQECQQLTAYPSNNNNNQILVYFVPSAPAHNRQRFAIRSTWGATVNPKPVFIVGYTEDLTVMRRVLKEAHKYQDLIIEDFLDTYWNLTLKTGFILKHFLSLCPQANFLIKTDDDMFIQPRILNQILSTADDDQLTGFVQRNAPPYQLPTDRYYLPPWMFDEPVLPDFISGWTYVLPGRRIGEIYEAALSLAMLNLEDVFFTGLVAGRHLNLTMVSSDAFTANEEEEMSGLCAFRDLAAFHNMPPRKLLKIWHKVQNLTREDCDRNEEFGVDTEESEKG